MSIMRSVRVANVNHISAIPYRTLADVEFIRYEENSAAENARKLHEGEVDVALISVAEFAMHGGYVGLDFGVGFKNWSDSLMLYSQVPLDEVETVNIYSGSSSTALLLRLLLTKYYDLSPLLVRRRRDNLLDYVVGKDAALVFHELPECLSSKYAVSIDLIRVWAEMTGKPYVSSVWAVRPGVLRPEHHRWFNEAFHRAAKARESLMSSLPPLQQPKSANLLNYVNECIGYYFDVPMIEGMEQFFQMTGDTSLLPRTKYRSATLTLIGRHVPRVSQERTVSQILEGVLDGARLGIREALRLAYEASISDVTLVADTIRSRISAQRLVRPLATVSLFDGLAGEGTSGSDPLPNLMSDIHAAVDAGALHVRIVGVPRIAVDVAFWERMLKRIKQRYPIVVEALSAAELHWMASLAGVAVEQLVSRLVQAGLDIVGGEGGDMLVDRVMADGLPGFVSVQEWLVTMRWVHRFGGSSRSYMRVSRHDSWEDRVLHLHKLRSLQDETPGFRSFSLRGNQVGMGEGLYGELEPNDRVPGEVKVRCTALARIFLDNVPNIEETELAHLYGCPDLDGMCNTACTAALLSVGAGVRDIRLPIMEGSTRGNVVRDSLGQIGISIDDEQAPSLARR